MSNLDYTTVPPEHLEEFLAGPALEPPDGVTPNFDNPDNKNTIAIITVALGLGLSTIFILIRAYMRLFVIKQRHVGDYLIVVAYGLFLPVVVGSLRRIANGPGLLIHQWDTRASDMKAYLYVIFIGTCFYGASMCLLKTAILWEWVNVFTPARERNAFFRACIAVMVINVVYYVTVIFVSVFACTPYARNFDKTIPGRCVDIGAVNLSAAIINFILDAIILALPQKIIWTLNMSSKRKIGISVIFAIGIAACAAAGCRIQAALTLMRSEDVTYHFSAVALWGIAELTCGFLVFSIPAVPRAVMSLTLPGWVLSIRSWAGSTSGRLRESRTSSGKSSRPRMPMLKSGEYHNIDKGTQVQLKPIADRGAGGKGEGSLAGFSSNSGILRTTNFTAVETYGPHPTKDETHLQQPWARHEKPPQVAQRQKTG
jgi:hypothetical protein